MKRGSRGNHCGQQRLCGLQHLLLARKGIGMFVAMEGESRGIERKPVVEKERLRTVKQQQRRELAQECRIVKPSGWKASGWRQACQASLCAGIEIVPLPMLRDLQDHPLCPSLTFCFCWQLPFGICSCTTVKSSSKCCCPLTLSFCCQSC